MKYIFLLIFVISLACATTPQSSVNTNVLVTGNLANKPPKLKLKLITKVSYPLYDFVYYNDELIGSIMGITDLKEQLVRLDIINQKTQLKEFNLKEVKWKQINAISLSGDNLWLVSENGIIIKGNPNLDTWEIISRIKSTNPEMIEFINEKTGYLVDNIFTKKERGCRIYKTENGGKTWKQVFKGVLTGSVSSLQVVSDNEVLIAMNDEYLLKTKDGGKTWQPQGLGYEVTNLDEILKLNKSSAKDITISSDNNYWVVGGKGSIFFSEDQGNSWLRPPQLPQGVNDQIDFTSIAFSPSGKGIVISSDGFIMVSQNFGSNWKRVTNEALRESNVTFTSDKLLVVKYTKENFIILGKSGIYQLSF